VSSRSSAIVILLPIVTTACVFEFRFDERASIAADAGSDSMTFVTDEGAPDNEAGSDLDGSPSSSDASTGDALSEAAVDASGTGDAVDGAEAGDTGKADGPAIIPETPDAVARETAMSDTAMLEAMPPPDAPPPDAAVPPDTLPPVDTLPPADTGVAEAAAEPDTPVPVDTPSEAP